MNAVSVVNQGAKFWLRNTVWTSSAERAQQFDSPGDAQAQLDKAKKFMAAKHTRQL